MGKIIKAIIVTRPEDLPKVELGHSTITTTMDIYVKPDIKDDPKYLDKANINLG